MTPQAALDLGLGELGLELPALARERLLQYVQLLVKWNRTFNLTAIREPLKMVSHHLLDSLAVVPHLPMTAGGAIADIGSGGGVPGIPLAIARPEWKVVLNDSSEKKATFMRQAVIELRLPNVSVHQGRVEAWHPAPPFRVVISRAFAEVAQFIAACRHIVAPWGTIAAMKGARPNEELARVPAGCECAEPIRLEVPLLGAERHLVLCRMQG